nr:hypothetical protein [Tanacetum cinerariifolium]
MSSAFADTHNMVAILTKSNASKGFDQIIDFLNGSYIRYAFTVNPHIYISCIKQFWNTVTVKQSTDVTRLQALVDRKKVVISEAVIRDILRLDDAEGVDCLPNEEIFTGLARMGYEKPSTKLTFYKALFSSQWKFLIHTILLSLSAKRTSWNEFSSAMASIVICLSTGRKFNFSKYIFDSLVQNVDSSSKFYMYPRIGKGFSGVEIPLFESMLVRENVEVDIGEEQVPDDTAVVAAQQVVTTVALEDVLTAVLEDVHNESIPSSTPPTLPRPPSQDIPSTSQTALDACVALTLRVKHLEHDKVAQTLEITKLKSRVKKLERANKGMMIIELDRHEGIELMGEQAKDIVDDAQVEGRQAEKQAKIYRIDLDHPLKVLSIQEDNSEVQEVVE